MAAQNRLNRSHKDMHVIMEQLMIFSSASYNLGLRVAVSGMKTGRKKGKENGNEQCEEIARD